MKATRCSDKDLTAAEKLATDAFNRLPEIDLEFGPPWRVNNGILDPGEDTDMDGVLDHPNTMPGKSGPFDVIGLYEHETNTLIAKPCATPSLVMF